MESILEYQVGPITHLIKGRQDDQSEKRKREDGRTGQRGAKLLSSRLWNGRKAAVPRSYKKQEQTLPWILSWGTLVVGGVAGGGKSTWWLLSLCTQLPSHETLLLACNEYCSLTDPYLTILSFLRQKVLNSPLMSLIFKNDYFQLQLSSLLSWLVVLSGYNVAYAKSEHSGKQRINWSSSARDQGETKEMCKYNLAFKLHAIGDQDYLGA